MQPQSLTNTGTVILKQRKDLDEVKSTRLTIPTEDGKSFLGEVVTVSEKYPYQGVWVNTTLKPGDIVVYGQFNSTRFKIGNTEYISVKEFDVLSKINLNPNKGL